MKYAEIILKVVFVAGVVLFFTAREYFLLHICWFLGIALILGVVLIFNKKQSYGYKLAHREVIMRRVEGVLLIIFGTVLLLWR